jgi:hypothetical protein
MFVGRGRGGPPAADATCRCMDGGSAVSLGPVDPGVDHTVFGRLQARSVAGCAEQLRLNSWAVRQA